MRRVVFILSFFSIFFGKTWAQNDIILFNNAHPWKGDNALLDSVLKKYPISDTIYFRIPLTFWIYVNKQGFGPGPSQIKKQLDELNKYFSQYNHTGIKFYLAGIHYVKSQQHIVVGYFIENFLITLENRIQGTVNIHLVRHISFLGNENKIGGTFNSLTKAIILTLNNFPTGLSHEMGHYFGLLHPHRNWNKGKLLAESVSRTRKTPISHKRNCEVRGDYLCDTPAEPDLSKCTNDKCRYTCHYKDPWGAPYKPDTDNIMSYFENKHCRKHFTKMQIAAMLLTICRSKYASFWANTRENRIFKPDKYEPDNYLQIASPIEPGIVQYHSFNSIYTAKKILYDKADFVKFLYQQGYTYFLTFKRGTTIFPAIEITIYDNFIVPIFTQIITNPTTIKLPDLQPNIYYIKILQINRAPKVKFYDYKIRLEKIR